MIYYDNRLAIYLFDINQTWQGGDQKEVTIQVTYKTILSLIAARLLGINILKEYKNHFGTLDVTLQRQSQDANV